MGKGDNRIMKRRLANAYLSSLISISLVLLLVGIASMLLVNAKGVSDYFKENVQVSVMMKQNVQEEAAMAFCDELGKERFIKSTVFVSREQGERELARQLGDDFLDVFETSPIPVSIDVTLMADYVSSDSLEVVRREISASPLVEEVNYQMSLVEALNANLSKISSVLGIFICLMLFICPDKQYREAQCVCPPVYYTYHEARRGNKAVHTCSFPRPGGIPGHFRGLPCCDCADCDNVLHQERLCAAFRDIPP